MQLGSTMANISCFKYDEDRLHGVAYASAAIHGIEGNPPLHKPSQKEALCVLRKLLRPFPALEESRFIAVEVVGLPDGGYIMSGLIKLGL